MSVPSIQDCKLCFIGGGNMGAAIVAGLLANGSSSPDNITVSDPSEATRHKAQTTLGVRTTASNLEAARGAHVLVLAVKPQVARAVCVDLARAWAEDDDDQQQQQQEGRPWPLVVSIVGGVTLTSLAGWLTLDDGRVPKVVRVMPNTPALLGEGASGTFAGEGVSADEKGLVADLLSGFSKVTEWVEREELIDVVTGVSGTYCPASSSLPPTCVCDIASVTFFTKIAARVVICANADPARQSHRIRTGLLLCNGRAHHLQCHRHGIAQ